MRKVIDAVVKGKEVIPILLIILFMSLSINLKAQAPLADKSILAVQDERAPVHCIKDFSASLLDNIVYINLIMKGEKQESVMLLEKSVNGSDFIVIEKRNGVAAPNGSTELLYSFRDSGPITGKASYRIKQFRMDGVLYTKVATVYGNGNPAFVQNKAKY